MSRWNQAIQISNYYSQGPVPYLSVTGWSKSCKKALCLIAAFGLLPQLMLAQGKSKEVEAQGVRPQDGGDCWRLCQ